MTANQAGALVMVASMGCFTVNDMFVKLIGSALPLFQLLLIRGLIATSMIFAIAYAMGGLNFRMSRKDWFFVALRCLGELGAAYFFVTALRHMHLASLSAILQMLPLTVSLGAALCFQERIGYRRMMAILVGFAGMLLIVQPFNETFNVYSIYGVITVFFVTLRDLATRRLSSRAHSMTVTMMAALVVTAFSGCVALGSPWNPEWSGQLLFLMGAAVFSVAGYYFSVCVMRIGDIGFTAQFRYTSLLWALLIGIFVFQEYPNALTVIGAVIVALTGLFTLHREQRVRGR